MPGASRSERAGGLRLDWCCIGAQKAGTSTLYRLLRDHPQLAIPRSKEDPIFDADVTGAAVRNYLKDRFGGVIGAKCGTVTPQYMSSPDTAERMHTFASEARIIVLLRDPVERAVSHYRMSVLRGLETRSFGDAVAHQLSLLTIGDQIDLDSETDTYVVRGDYGWLLRGWYERFGSANILPVFSADLDSATGSTLEQIQRFLEVEPQPADEADFRFNATPPPHRLSGFRKPVAQTLRRVGWDRIDVERRERISSRVESILAKAMPGARSDVSPAAMQALCEYYAPRLAPLTKLIGATPPWATTGPSG